MTDIPWPDSFIPSPPLRGLQNKESVNQTGVSFFPNDYHEKGIVCYEIPKTSHFRKYTNIKSTTKKLIQWHDTLETLTIPFFQYKVARSGSTLLSNILATDPRWKIVSEPFARIPCVSQLFESYKKNTSKYYILQKILEILAVKENPEQQFCYIDLSSLFMFHIHILKQIFPNIIHYLLWRHPKYVVSSLARHPPPWKSRFKNISEYIEKTMQAIPNDMIVFYHGHIEQFLLPYWIYKTLHIDFFTDAPIEKMRFMLQRDAKDPNRSFQRKNIPSHIYHAYNYNEANINFELQHPPWEYILNIAQNVKTVSFSNDTFDLVNQIMKGSVPILINNYTEIPDMNISTILGKQRISFLKAHRENYFVYSNKHSLKYPITLSQWVNGDFEYWKQNPSLYANITMSEISIRNEEQPPFHPAFMDILNCIKKVANGCKKPDCPCQQRIDYPIIRISHKGARSAEHIDLYGSFLYNVTGRKSVILFSPEESQKLGIYPPPLDLERRIIANIAYFNPVLFPKVDLTKAYHVTMRAKDLLYFPPGWAHFFITEEEETVSLGWRMEKQACKIMYPSLKTMQYLTEAQMPDYHKGMPVIEWNKIPEDKIGN